MRRHFIFAGLAAAAIASAFPSTSAAVDAPTVAQPLALVTVAPPLLSTPVLDIDDMVAATIQADLLAQWLAWERSEWLRVEADNARDAALRAEWERAAPPSSPTSPKWLHAIITPAILNELGTCESGNRYDVNTGNGFRGRVQWLQGTWNSAARGAGRDDLVGVRPNEAAPADQDALTVYWWSVSDYRGQWPVCGPRAVARAG